MKRISMLCWMAISKTMAETCTKINHWFSNEKWRRNGLKFHYNGKHSYIDILINLVVTWYLCSGHFLSHYTAINNLFHVIYHLIYKNIGISPFLWIRFLITTYWFLFPYTSYGYQQLNNFSDLLAISLSSCFIISSYIYHGQNNFLKSHFYAIIAILKYFPLKTIPLPKYL